METFISAIQKLVIKDVVYIPEMIKKTTKSSKWRTQWN